MSGVAGTEFARVAFSFVGTPFKHRGRAPGIGLDCAGLVICASAACGVQVSDSFHYGPDPDPDMMLQQVRTVAVPHEALEDGAVALFAMRGGKPTHLGVFAHGHLAHADRVAGKVRVERMGRPWLSRLHSIWRIPGVSLG